ncbi:MAG: hypothetical protein AAB344_01635 [Bacteroidota bacterium]
MRQQCQLLPYFLTLAFATLFVQALMFGYDTAGMRGVFIAISFLKNRHTASIRNNITKGEVNVCNRQK